MKTIEYLGIKIQPEKDNQLSEQALTLLKNFYCKEHDKSVQHAFARASVAYCQDDLELAQRIYDYASKGWFMFASPVLSNAPLPNEKPEAMNISCFLTYVPDTREGLIEHSSELRWLSVLGGGVGGHWSKIRSACKKSPGIMPFIHTVDADMVAYRQSSTRKGSYAAYLDIHHPDIEEFIEMRVPIGDINRKNLNLHHGVNVTDKFMGAVECNDDFDLVDPNDGSVRKTVSARYLWELMLKTRLRTGEPYLNFIDTSIRAMPISQKKKGLTLQGSNLCNEVMLATNSRRTAVCCLSSLNVEMYDEWKDSNIVQDLIHYLDRVLSFFIEHAPDVLSKAVFSAKMERAVGLGQMGLHSYLQSKMVAFGSDRAKSIDWEISTIIHDRSLQESLRLGKLLGEPDDMKGTGLRNSHRIAIAPNANSSLILDTSPSIEPWSANAFSSRTRAGTHLRKNKHLEEQLELLGHNNDEVWTSIITNKGSVQHLDFLSEDLKNVFKTAIEIDQIKLIEMAGKRQKNICQGQSLNVFFPAKPTKKSLHDVHYLAWKNGCKGLYYLRTEKSSKVDNISDKTERVALSDVVEGEVAGQESCVACEG